MSWADFKIYVQMQAAKRSQTPLPSQVDSVVYLVDAYDKERFAEAKKELDALHKKQQQY
ncbi:unnamed protein product [Camellia sinensis]